MLEPQMLAQIDKRHAQGETWAELAKDVGISVHHIRKLVYTFRRGQSLVHHPEPMATLDSVNRDDLLDTLMRSLLSTQSSLRNLDDRQPATTVTLQDTAPAMVVFLGDTHIGGVGVNHQQLQQDMECIRDTPGCYGLHLGDHADNFSPAVLPKAMLEQLLNPNLQWELAELFFRRHLTTDKLLAGIEGNHDAFSSSAGLRPCQEMYRRLKVPFLGPGGRVWLKLGEETYKIEARHDFPFKSSLNTTNSQRRLAELTMGADVVALAHTHSPDVQHTYRGGMAQVWLRTGTYKREDAWADAKGLQFAHSPVPPDMPGVIFWPGQHKTLPFLRFQDGAHTLRVLRGDAFDARNAMRSPDLSNPATKPRQA